MLIIENKWIAKRRRPRGGVQPPQGQGAASHSLGGRRTWKQPIGFSLDFPVIQDGQTRIFVQAIDRNHRGKGEGETDQETSLAAEGDRKDKKEWGVVRTGII